MSDSMYINMLRHRNWRAVPPPFVSPAPAQDSPKHILNALNAECIQRILTYLIGDIRDFLSAAEVCKKFQENAKECFPSIYTDFYMGHENWNFVGERLPMDQVRNFLRIFGHLLRSIYWDPNTDNFLKEIAEFCGNNLVHLKIINHHVDFKVSIQFKSLEVLDLDRCTVDNFELPPTVRKLHLYGGLNFSDMEWMSKTHPNLIDVNFFGVVPNDELSDDMIIQFQAMNPQLQHFNVFTHDLTSSILKGISERQPNLILFKFNTVYQNRDRTDFQRKFEEDVMNLSGLQYLRCLLINKLPCHTIDSLAANNIPIEDLTITQYDDELDPGTAKSVVKLINIRKLKLSALSYEMALHLVMNLPHLEVLDLCRCTHFSLNGIKRILEVGQNLKVFKIHDENMLIDSVSMLDSILELALERVQVEIRYNKENICIPEQNRPENQSHWLNLCKWG